MVVQGNFAHPPSLQSSTNPSFVFVGFGTLPTKGKAPFDRRPPATATRDLDTQSVAGRGEDRCMRRGARRIDVAQALSDSLPFCIPVDLEFWHVPTGVSISASSPVTQ